MLRSWSVLLWLLFVIYFLSAKSLWTYPVHVVFSKMILIHQHVIELLAVQILGVLLGAAGVHVGHLACSSRSRNLTGLAHQAHFLLLSFVNSLLS